MSRPTGRKTYFSAAPTAPKKAWLQATSSLAGGATPINSASCRENRSRRPTFGNLMH